MSPGGVGSGWGAPQGAVLGPLRSDVRVAPTGGGRGQQAWLVGLGDWGIRVVLPGAGPGATPAPAGCASVHPSFFLCTQGLPTPVSVP